MPVTHDAIQYIGRARGSAIYVAAERNIIALAKGWMDFYAEQILTIAFLIGTALAAAAQSSAMPADLVWKPIEIRNVVVFPKTADDYATLQEKEPYQGIKVERDIRYGPAERNLLDVFTPETDSSAQPVLIFIHGGAFAAGDKHSTGGPFYDNIALWAARHGFIGVTMTYRLASQSPCGRRGGHRTCRKVGRRQYRQPRRRWIAHLPVGSLGRRDSCRELCLAPRISQSQGRRDQSRYHALWPLRSHGKCASRSREGLFRRRFRALCGALLD
jgi:hypothetical protein